MSPLVVKLGASGCGAPPADWSHLVVWSQVRGEPASEMFVLAPDILRLCRDVQGFLDVGSSIAIVCERNDNDVSGLVAAIVEPEGVIGLIDNTGTDKMTWSYEAGAGLDWSRQPVAA